MRHRFEKNFVLSVVYAIINSAYKETLVCFHTASQGSFLAVELILSKINQAFSMKFNINNNGNVMTTTIIVCLWKKISVGL